MKQLAIPTGDEKRLYAGFFDDMDHFVTNDRWTVVATDSGGATGQDAANGVVLLDCSDGTVADNDEVYLKTKHEIFKFAADKPLILEARINFTEANTDDANMIFGVANAVAANHLQDDGAGPPASYSGAVFFKVDGETTWQVEFSDSTTQTTEQLDGTQANQVGSTFSSEAQTAGGGWEVLRIEFRPLGNSKADIIFWKDGVPVAKFKDKTYANASEMNVFIGAKNGDTNEETVQIDYVMAYQKR